MKKKKSCEFECPKICDFCYYYDFAGEDLVLKSGKIIKGAIYVGKGYCNHPDYKKVAKDPGDPACLKFICEICAKKNKKK